ncbi:MAG TPA: hydrogen gas-evolving membrane-bound hydrogenase subunit E [Jiangellales bacterium]|nr:hydrogen gas-evolving membrane-bound hydrogenase subunit E [Jiangellales bacterium]
MILVWALVTMLVAAALAPFVARRLGNETGYPLAGVFLVVLAMVMSQYRAVVGNETIEYVTAWIPVLGVDVALRLDGLSLLFAMVVLGVGVLIMLYCPRYLSSGAGHGRLFGILTLFAAAMLGLVLADDVVLLFVCWELTTLCSFLLVGGRGQATVQKPATRAFVITAGGGLALLAAVVMLSVVAGTTRLSEILAQTDVVAQSPLYPWIGALVVVAALSKSAQMPLHFWLPDAMVAITPVSAYLHAATLVKGGVYLLLRFSPLYADRPEWHLTLMTVGLVTAVVGALFALQQYDLKSILAYSTVSQLGWIIALVGVGTTAALAAAALHTFAHALFKATLFMLVGIIDREAGSRDIRELEGLWRMMPITATLTALAALSMAGIPPLVGFVSKEEAYYAFLSTSSADWTYQGSEWTGNLAAGIAVVAACLTFAYGFRILHGAFGGRLTQRTLYEPRAAFWLPAAIPAVAGLLLGLYPQVLNPLVTRSVEDTAFTVAEADLALWHGFTVALALSALTVAVGALLFVRRAQVDVLVRRLRFPVTGAEVFDGLYDRAIRLGAVLGRPARSGATGAQLAWPLGGLVVLAGAGLLALAPPPAPPVPTTEPADWVLVALLAVAVVALAAVRNRLAALGLLGVAGLVVAATFLSLGAPDLALTQVLVEILTVVVAVLVLRRLPARFRSVPRPRQAAAATLALAAGVVVGAGTYLLTGRRERSEVADYLLREAEEATGGTNVVNTVLVDFRGLDTLGEVAVLAVAALGLLVLLAGDRQPAPGPVPPIDAVANSADVVFRIASRVLGPLVLVLAAWLLLRGHNEPGGGFIAALVAGAGVAVTQLPRGPSAGPRLPSRPLVAGGLAIAALTGLLGFAESAYLRPLKAEPSLLGVDLKLTSSLVFDVGVFLVVVGLVVAALDRLARGQVPGGDAPDANAGPDGDPGATRAAGVAAGGSGRR